MEFKFNVTKEERKELVGAAGEITGRKPVYRGAPSFAFTVGDYTIDRHGTLIYGGDIGAEDVRLLLTGLAERGFEHEEIESNPFEDGESAAEGDGSPIRGRDAPEEASDRLTIEIPLVGFTGTALVNLERLVVGKAALIRKAVGADALPIERTMDRLRFPWFSPDASPEAAEAYSTFIAALCETAKTQKRVILKEKPLDEGASEKFAMRCFLLKLGFIGSEYKEARKILLANMSGSGSHKSGDGKKASPEGVATAIGGGESAEASCVREDGSGAADADTGGDTAVCADGVPAQDEAAGAAPLRCDNCRHHSYYTDGPLRTVAGDVVDTSKRAPDKYTHYCLNAPSGFRRIKHAYEWSGLENAPKWCPLLKTGGADNAGTVGGTGGYRDRPACANSLGEPAENADDTDRLFCAERREYVGEDGFCDGFNCQEGIVCGSDQTRQ
jgi:hypothetical protein